MKKFLVLSVSAVMAVSLLAGCGSEKTSATAAEGAEVTEATETDGSAETEETAEKTETTEEGRTFTVGFDAEFPPYGYMDENGDLTEAADRTLGSPAVRKQMAGRSVPTSQTL